jgi:putative flavoprotein involved in K+ transport
MSATSMKTRAVPPRVPVEQVETAIVGAGAAGLGVASELERRGMPLLLLEGADRVATSWHNRYEGLRLNTVRWMSAPPGGRIRRRAGRWPTREEFAAHLELCAERVGPALRTGVEVSRIDWDGDRWVVRTGDGDIRANNVVVATGYDREPAMPSWPGRDEFEGRHLHAAEYRSPKPFAGEDVLVVGAGNTGTEIATQLAHGGAARVRLSMRTPPNLMPPSLFGLPITVFARLNEPQPDALVDRGARLIQRLRFGDLRRYGLPAAPNGIATHLKLTGCGPVLDRGFVDALRAGELSLVSALERFDRDRVLLADGTELRPDSVIAATGYRHGLEPLVGHLGVLDDRGRPAAQPGEPHPDAPGLYFNGYWLPFSGQLPAMRRTARRIAKSIATDAAAF